MDFRDQSRAVDPNCEFLCPFCGHPARLVWVHGHGQCSHCFTNVDECCRGEQFDPNQKAVARLERKHTSRSSS